jgi:glyoxylase-like metal-dependent hydrolase (beta-lactamase superfamily II)
VSEEETQFRPPTIDPSTITEVADGVWVIPDKESIPMVPNIGIVCGDRATLVVDTGLGIDNARRVLGAARELGGAKPLFLTLTHFHAEHGLGAEVFLQDGATLVYNAAQWDELEVKAEAYTRLFLGGAPELEPYFAGVEFPAPHVLYKGEMWIDLGGRIAELREYGGGHSLGDQVVLLRDAGVLFTGDLVENKVFGVIPDGDSHLLPWLQRLREMEELGASIIVPGHGMPGGPEVLTIFREYFEYTDRRATELRDSGVSEDEIVDTVEAELLARHPDWANKPWARVAVADLKRPARA